MRYSERRRARADSSKRASEPDAEPRPRARWSTHYSPRTHVPLTWRLRRAVAVWPEGTGLTPAPAFRRRRHLLLHGHRAASPGAASLGAATRGAAMRGAACAAPPAPSLRSAACTALPLPRRLRRDASRRDAARGAASRGSAPHRAASPVRPCLRPAPLCEDITKSEPRVESLELQSSLYRVPTGGLPLKAVHDYRLDDCLLKLR